MYVYTYTRIHAYEKYGKVRTYAVGGRGGAGGVGERLRSRLLMKTCHTGSFNRLTALAYLAVGLLGDTSVGLLRLCHLLDPPFPPRVSRKLIEI